MRLQPETTIMMKTPLSTTSIGDGNIEMNTFSTEAVVFGVVDMSRLV